MADTRPAYLIHTWGCQMNDDDSRQMANLLEQIGYREASEDSDADIILLNTCSVRDKPEQKVKSKLGELRQLKVENPNLIIGVCGCMAQREGKALLKGASIVDMVIGTAAIYELPMLIEQAKSGRGRIVADDMPDRGTSNGNAHTPRVTGRVGLKQFVPVMYGCNNFCTYCVVPSARGPERSRPPDEIVAEVEQLVSRGCREVTLIGQNVNSYQGEVRSAECGVRIGEGAEDLRGESGHSSLITHQDFVDFAELLVMLDEIKGLERIRFTTSHPKDLSERLINAMAELPKVCEHLHLPIQSGDDEILRRMGRKYTVEQYMQLVDRLRTRIPEISLTTDVMVGFPGETGAHFRNTLLTIGEIHFDAAFMFAFNPRPGTAAAKMPGQVEHSVKTRRLIELICIQNEITLETNQSDVGGIFQVLVEGPSEKDPTKLTGYTRKNKTVNFPGSARLVGRLVRVRAVSGHPWGFSGEMVNG
ncbi:MAG: tRNA (N6-isopentenyl adenosine(37)-C2)-methylthiotransferase MiaB [Armatimonadetes bacterium]|nr:tRNA (N6-isopentenyl adenosine(37)-C2)-methylthiotransferase MiaB [Armatimonadota bacterium]